MPSSIKWRIYLPDVPENTGSPTITNIEMRGVRGGADLCINGFAAASSVWSSTYDANKVFDDLDNTIWHQASGAVMPQWLEYNFVSAVSIKQLVIKYSYRPDDQGRPLGEIWAQYHNGTEWITAQEIITEPLWGILEERVFELAEIFQSENFEFSGSSVYLKYPRKLSYLDTVKVLGAVRHFRLGELPEDETDPTTGFANEEIIGDHGIYSGGPKRAGSLLLEDPDYAASFITENFSSVLLNYRRALADRTLKNSIHFWINAPTVINGSEVITIGRHSPDINTGMFRILIGSDHLLQISIHNQAGDPYWVVYKGQKVLSAERPHAVCIVLDLDIYHIYVDGNLDSIFTADHVFDYSGYYDVIEIGKLTNYYSGADHGAYITAVIDEVSFFEDALQPEQINELFFAGNAYKYVSRPEAGHFSFNGAPVELVVNSPIKIITNSANFAFQGHPARSIVIKHTEGVGDGSLAAITGDARQTPVSPNLHVRDPIYNGEDYPPANWQCAPGSLPGYGNTGFYPCPDHSSPPDIPAEILIGEYVRNDRYILPVWTHEGVLTRHAQVILSGCYVTPKEIFYDTESAGDQHFNIVISNNDIGRPLLIESMTIWEGDHHAYGMEILEADFLPMWIPAYSYQTFTLVIYGSTGNQKIDAVLEVRVGTCDTDIPITGLRLIECPKLPEPCQPCPEEEVDMAQCMIEQALCAISRGDSVPFSFRFTESGEPLDITGMTLQLTLKEDIKQKVPNLIKEVVFPDNITSQEGLGGMTLTPEDTMTLRAGITYCFKFKLINGPDDISTIGLGTIPVNPDPHAE